ncbi:hypothetical protein ACVFI8_01370 [Agarivorans sp. MS3-6]
MMNWNFFKFYSNELLRKLSSESEVTSAIKIVDNTQIINEFSVEKNSNNLITKIISTIQSKEFSKEDAEKVLKIYSQLDVSELDCKPSQLKRVGVYIGYLAVVFFVMSSIYMIFVVPQALEMFDSFNFGAPEEFVWFVNHWGAIFSGISSLIFISILINLKIKKMFEYQVGVSKSLIYRMLIPGGIKTKYQKLISLILLPIFLVKSKKDGISDDIIDHFNNESFNEMEITETLSLLINDNVNNLVLLSEAYIRRVYIVVAVLIVFCIFKFVSSVYAPIFVLGEAI